MSNMQLYQNSQFGKLRVFVIDDQPWFIAKDVCDALDIGNPSQAVTRLDDDEKGITTNDTPGGNQESITVSEPGLYTLILTSRKPEAKAFKRWITHDVIPAIRRNGVYATPAAVEEMTPEELMAKALIAANATIERMTAERDAAVKARAYISSRREATLMGRLGNEVRRNERLEAENNELKAENGELRGILGIENEFSAVCDIPWVLQYMFFDSYNGNFKVDVFTRLSSGLKRICDERGIVLDPKTKVQNSRGRLVNAYPRSVIDYMEQCILSKSTDNFYYRFMSDYLKPRFRA